jgi:hypothetical protein
MGVAHQTVGHLLEVARATVPAAAYIQGGLLEVGFESASSTDVRVRAGPSQLPQNHFKGVSQLPSTLPCGNTDHGEARPRQTRPGGRPRMAQERSNKKARTRARWIR